MENANNQEHSSLFEGLKHPLVQNLVQQFKRVHGSLENPLYSMKNLEAILECSSNLHMGQKRKNYNNPHESVPYIAHPIRVAINAMRLTQNDELVVIALLHDTLEDGAENFYRDSYYKIWGYETLEQYVQELVDDENNYKALCGLTNPPELNSMTSKQDKNKMYFHHVSMAIHEDIKVFLVKFSDFMDNAGNLRNLYENDFYAMSKGLSKKYRMIIPEFVSALNQWKNQIPHDSFLYIENKLADISSDIEHILSKKK